MANDLVGKVLSSNWSRRLTILGEREFEEAFDEYG